MSKYLEYLIELLEVFKKVPNSLTEDEGQILLRLLRKAHKEDREDFKFILSPPEDKVLIPAWLREGDLIYKKHTSHLWTKYYQLVLEIDQQQLEF